MRERITLRTGRSDRMKFISGTLLFDISIRLLIFIFFFTFSIISFLSCSKKDPDKKEEVPPVSEDFLKYTGTYRIEPTAYSEILVLNPNGSAVVTSRKNTDRVLGRYVINKDVLRIFLEEGKMTEGPEGTFLIKAYRPEGWRGMWKEEVKALQRIDEKKPQP